MRRIANSAIRRFERCIASYFYYMILPRLERSDKEDLSRFGRKFHEWAEADFSPGAVDYIFEDTDPDQKSIEELSLAVKGRTYWNYPSVNELSIECDVPPYATVWGYPDRISVDLENSRLIIPDYKTSFDPDPKYDLPQLMLYAHIMYNSTGARDLFKRKLLESNSGIPEDKLSSFLDNLTPGQITVIIDYVKSDYVYVVDLDDARMKRYERYLFTVLRRIHEEETEFATVKNRNINKVTHTDGNCRFCFMSGICRPYRMIFNSYYDSEFEREVMGGWGYIMSLGLKPEDPVKEDTLGYPAGTLLSSIMQNFCMIHGIDLEQMKQGVVVKNTMGLISEYLERQRISKINEGRLAVLKSAIMSRYEANDPDATSYFAKQKSTIVSYDTRGVIKDILPRIVKAAVKDARFKAMIDTDRIEENLEQVILSMLGGTVKKSSIPEEYHQRIEKFKSVSYTKPYLRSTK